MAYAVYNETETAITGNKPGEYAGKDVGTWFNNAKQVIWSVASANRIQLSVVHCVPLIHVQWMIIFCAGHRRSHSKSLKVKTQSFQNPDYHIRSYCFFHILSHNGERGSSLVWHLLCQALTFPRWHFSLFDSTFGYTVSDWGLVLTLSARLRIFSVLNVISLLTRDAGAIAGRGRCTHLNSSAPTAPYWLLSRCFPLRFISMQEDV